MDNLGPSLGGKPLHVFWLLDVSGSMSVAGKIDALNDAMRVAVDSVRDAAAENPTIEVFARAIAFAHDADWVGGETLPNSVIPQGIPIADFRWSNISVVDQGTTEVGRAIDLASHAIAEVSQSGRGLPPALILVSDGKPTDLKAPSYGASLRALAEHPWGRKASRMAIGIGDDADMDALHQFTGHEEIPPLKAANAEDLRHYLRWASTVVVDEGSRPTTDWQERDTVHTSAGGPDHQATASGEQTQSPAATISPADTTTQDTDAPDDVDGLAAPTGLPHTDLPPPPGVDEPDSTTQVLPPPPPPPPPPPGGAPVW